MTYVRHLPSFSARSKFWGNFGGNIEADESGLLARRSKAVIKSRSQPLHSNNPQQSIRDPLINVLWALSSRSYAFS
jgi:hypothetical protein